MFNFSLLFWFYAVFFNDSLNLSSRSPRKCLEVSLFFLEWHLANLTFRQRQIVIKLKDIKLKQVSSNSHSSKKIKVSGFLSLSLERAFTCFISLACSMDYFVLNKLLHFSALLSTHSLERGWSLGFRGRGIGKIISFFLLIKSKLITRANTRQKLLLHCLICLFVSCFLLFFFWAKG